MKEIQVGKVMLTFKGEYDSTKTYTRLDAVTYQGSSYVCLADTSSTPPSDSWQVLAQKGTDGKDGKDGQPGHDGKDGKDGQTPDVSNMATKDELAEYYPQKVITTGTVDFNTLTGSGEFLVGTKCTNGPTDGSGNAWYYVFVSGDSGSRVSQLVFLDNTNRSYYRRKTDATWSDWVAFANFSDIGDQLGDYYTKSQTDSEINKIQIGGRNLVIGTADDFVADDTANTKTQGWLFKMLDLTQEFKVGDQVTVSAEGTLTGKGDLSTYEVILYSADTLANRSNSKRLKAGTRSSATLTVTNLNGKGPTKLLIYAGNISDTEGKKNTIHHLKVELGNKATDWTPAPEDLLSKSEAEETYAKKSDIPTSMAWQNITNKPDVATKSDIPTSIDWNSVTNKPDLATSAGLPKDLVHTTDLDKTNQKVSDVELTANQALSVATNGQSIATDAQNEAQSVSARVETLTNQLNSANQVRTITSGTLADLANKNGQYHYEIDCIPSDLPSGVSAWGMCDVTVGPHYAKEIFTVTGANDNNGRVFVRVRGYGSSAWNDWREVTLWS